MPPTRHRSVSCQSAIIKVDVYARGAIVTRRVTLPEDLGGDAVELGIEDITRLAQPGSFQAHMRGREVVGLRSEVVYPHIKAEPPELQAELQTLTRKGSRLQALRNTLAERKRELKRIDPTTDLTAKKKKRSTDWLLDRLAAGELLSAIADETDEAIAGLDQQFVDNRRAISAARVAWNNASGAQKAGADQIGRRLVVLVAEDDASEQTSAPELSISYTVSAARWWPAYAARIKDGAALWSMEAFVAQDTREDWSGVALSLCTADLERALALPELQSLRLGRRQPAKKTGYRPPPEGLDALFSDYDTAIAPPSAAPPKPKPMPPPVRRAPAPLSPAPMAPAPEVASFGAMEGAPMAGAVFAQGAPPPSPPRAAAPSMAQSVEKVKMSKKRAGGAPTRRASSIAPGGGGGGPMRDKSLPEPPAPLEPTEIEPAEGWSNFDLLVMRSGEQTGPQRGRLTKRSMAGGAAADIKAAALGIERAPAPPKTRDPRSARGMFDHRYEARGRAEVDADARPHRVSLQTVEASCKTMFRAVPREQEDVFREVELLNPFESPLLAGPVDVFVDGALVTTSEISNVGQGGRIFFGLGTEDRIRISRNIKVNESAQGFFKGTAAIAHTVEVEIASSLGFALTVDVVDRVPVTDDEDIHVALDDSTPEPTRYDQVDRDRRIRGGLRWTLPVPPAGRSTLTYTYTVSLPAKYEIKGGNRRE